MKKTILTTILISTIILAKAQTGETGKVNTAINETGKNELKINLLTSVLALPEISYERILEDNMSVGISLAAGIGNEDDFSEYRFLAIPHYRLYFGKKRAAGFFIEGNAAVGSVREDHWDYSQNGFDVAYSSNVVNFGLGAAVGAKFLTRNGFLGEVFAGVGRFLGSNRSIEAYPRIGITLGKRF